MPVSRRDFVAALAAMGAAGTLTAASKSVAEVTNAADQADSFPVYVIATVTAKEGRRDDLVRIFKTIIPDTHAEDGCIYYEPAVDVETGLDAQSPLRPNVMVVVEKWESLEHLRAHLVAPHMGPYREAVKDIVESVRLEVLRRAY